jgi:hypothetical protein
VSGVWTSKVLLCCWAWWHMVVIPAIGRLRWAWGHLGLHNEILSQNLKTKTSN